MVDCEGDSIVDVIAVGLVDARPADWPDLWMNCCAVAGAVVDHLNYLSNLLAFCGGRRNVDILMEMGGQQCRWYFWGPTTQRGRHQWLRAVDSQCAANRSRMGTDQSVRAMEMLNGY